jgi:aryl-alcohol dehydrogenase-like predicted oxidoreductase
MPPAFGEEVDFEWIVRTVRHVFDGPIDFLDTSNGYSQGESETRTGAMEEACARYRISLRAAALNTSGRDPRVNSTIVGTATSAYVDELVGLVSEPVPPPLWEELAALTPLGSSGRISDGNDHTLGTKATS